MIAAVLREFGKPLVLEDVPVPECGDDEVLVRVMASGLCGTDIHIRDGLIPTVKLPRIPGHETAGIVEKTGKNVTGLAQGDHVVVTIDRVCGKCRYCRTGRENLCTHLVRNGFEADGGHAEFMTAPQYCVCRLPDSIPFAEAAVLPDAVACMVHAVYDTARVQSGEMTCILGMGGLGFQTLQILKHVGARVLCTSRQDTKLELAEKYGADGCINTSRESLEAAVERLTGNELCDVVFDNIGNEDSIAQALRICAPGGRVIIVGYAAREFHGAYQDTMMHEKQVLGMRGSTRKNLLQAIELVRSGAVKPYVFRTLPLEKINEAMESLEAGHTLGRTVLIPPGGQTYEF